MSLHMQNCWFRRMGFGAIAALSLCAGMMSIGPAQAREFRGAMGVEHHMSHSPRMFFGGYHWHHWYHHWR